MKAINKILLVFLLSIGVASIFISCDKEDDDSGTPSVSYVRITRPSSSDSLLVGAGQGQLIAIVGNNLQECIEIWFNDQSSRLTPTYITNTTILVRIPTQIPLAINNKMKLVFKNGFVLNYYFALKISKQLISIM